MSPRAAHVSISTTPAGSDSECSRAFRRKGKTIKKKADKNNREKESRAHLSRHMRQLENFLLEVDVKLEKMLSESNRKTAGHNFKKDEILIKTLDLLREGKSYKSMMKTFLAHHVDSLRRAYQSESLQEKNIIILEMIRLCTNMLNARSDQACGIYTPDSTPPPP